MSMYEADAPLQRLAGRPDHQHDPSGATTHHGADGLVELQRAVGNHGVAQLLSGVDDRESIERATRSGGAPLAPETRVQMEHAFGADFSSVRLHTGSDADASAKQLKAHAYTVGDDIVFANGRFDPSSPTGQRTLAHELTHVVQQRSGPVDGSPTGGGVKVSDPSDRFELAAESMADRVMAGEAAAPAAEPAPAAAVQREGDEEEIQAMSAQREGDEEEVQEMSAQREGDEEEVQDASEA